MASCFVAFDQATGLLAGYYTLAAASFPAGDLPLDLLKRLPRYPTLPAALIGRLAIDARHQGKGLGVALLGDAAQRVLKGDIKAFAIIVDARDENAASFYRRHGFRPFASRPLSLYQPLAVIKAAANPEA